MTPNYWAGSGLLPRAAQYKNLTIAIYNIKKILALYVPIRHFFTHAWLPKDKFDEIVEKDNWIFARKDDGYLALRSQKPYVWNEVKPRSHPGPTGNAGADRELREKPLKNSVNSVSPWLKVDDAEREILVNGAQNIWLCQLGRKVDDGSFEDFIEAICSAELTFSGLNVEYRSPGIGLVRFGWEGPLSVDNVEIPLHDYPRYDNPYVQAEFDPSEIRVTTDERELYLNWETGERTTK